MAYRKDFSKVIKTLVDITKRYLQSGDSSLIFIARHNISHQMRVRL
ncbi:hypothetical protein VPHD249_0206 [Vibrio phage D249]